MQHYKASIEWAGTQDQEKLRAIKVKVFRWQAKTAKICLLARALLLYTYIKYTVEAQRQFSLTALDPSNIVAWAFIIMEFAFAGMSHR